MFPEKWQKMAKIDAPPTIRAYTLGCKVNFCDTNALLEAAIAAGFVRAAEGSQADAVVVNACAVTSHSIAKTRALVRRVRARQREAIILLTGCAVKANEPQLLAMKEVDHFFREPNEALAWLGRWYGLNPQPHSGGLDPERTRAFLKIQDGCDSFCSYCIVPIVRGKPQSLAPSSVMAALRRAVAGGYREIILSGIHLGHYGRDLEGVTLAALLKQIAGEEGDFRVRLSSIEPLEATEPLLATMALSKRFCPHLHLPLQSGSDRVLSEMRRPYNRQKYMEVVGTARRMLDNPAITTDIMVGFPGETEDDHRRTLDAIAEIGFARSHVFVYSPRPGTAAAALPDRVDPNTARRRSRQARDAALEAARRFREGLVGTVARVLPEEMVAGRREGFCERYQRVRFAGEMGLEKRFADVYISGTVASDQDVLEGRLIPGDGNGGSYECHVRDGAPQV